MPDPRDEVAIGCHVLEAEGLGDLIWGHVSQRDPDGRGTWMKASTFGLDEIGHDEIVLIDRAGEVLEGSARRHIEYPIHTEILAVRPDVHSVVHTHPPHGISFAATGAPLRPISHDGTLFVPPDIARFTETGDLIRTAELGAAVARALGDRNAVILHNHGVVTVGPDVPTAVMTAVLLERACQLQLGAMAAGGVVDWSPDDEAVEKRGRVWSEAQLRHGWDYLVRRTRHRRQA